MNSYKDKLLGIEPDEDYWAKCGDLAGDQEGDLSISDIEEEKEDIDSSSEGNSESGEGDLEDEGSSESDHDQSDQNQSDEEEKELNKKITGQNNLNNAANANPHLPVMYKRNRRMLRNIAVENRHKAIYKQIDGFCPKKRIKR